MAKSSIKKPKGGKKNYRAALTFAYLELMRTSCEECITPSENVPTFAEGLNVGTKIERGGICTLFLTKCNAAAFDETVLANWQNSINAGDTLVIRDCTIEASFAQEATTITRGCNADTVITTRQNTLTISDVSDNGSLDRAALYEYIQKFPNAFRIAWITYDGKLYKSSRATLNANRAIDNNTDGFDQVNIEATWKSITAPQGFNLANATIAWGADSLIIPNCTVQINVLGVSGTDYTLQAVPQAVGGIASVTSYAWAVNGVVEPLATGSTYTFTGLTAPDQVTVTVVVVPATGGTCTVTTSFDVPA